MKDLTKGYEFDKKRLEITTQNLQHENSKIQIENDNLKHQIKELKSHIFSDGDDAVIEKGIMKQVILTYFTKSNKKDVLTLISSLLVYKYNNRI